MKISKDRKDAKRIKNIDALHNCLISISPKRTENETCIMEVFDLTNMRDYLEKKNRSKPKYKYTMFQFIVAVIAKTVILRPKLNNFIANKKVYKRNYFSVAFTIKKQYDDKSEEGLSNIRFHETDNIDILHNNIQSEIYCVKNDTENKENYNLVFIEKYPKLIMKAFLVALRFLDKYGKLPSAFMDNDPNYSTVTFTNLGSIGLNSGYHHLNEWGTNSIFCIIGKAKKRPYFDENGKCNMKDSIELSFVFDERIADGYYCAKSISLMKYLFEHPDELDNTFSTSVNYCY